MSYLGRCEDAKREGERACHVIDGETKTSPVRDGGTDVGGAPVATNIGGTGPVEFTQTRGRTGIQDKGVPGMRRKYGQPNPTNYK